MEIAADERIGLTPDHDIQYGHRSNAGNDDGSDLDDEWDDEDWDED